MSYTPAPIDTAHIELPIEMRELVERLAEHNHDVWAAGRLGSGWTHGPRRDDDKKQHPCLVPYEELPEEEKEYDRSTVIQTLKAVLAMGGTLAMHSSP